MPTYIEISTTKNAISVNLNDLATFENTSLSDLFVNTIAQIDLDNNGKFIRVWRTDGRLHYVSATAVWNTLTAEQQIAYSPIDSINGVTMTTNAQLHAAIQLIIGINNTVTRQLITDIGTGGHLPAALYTLSSVIPFLGGWNITNRNTFVVYLGFYDSASVLISTLSIPAATSVIDGIREQVNLGVVQCKDVKYIKVSKLFDLSDATAFTYNLLVELISI